MTEERSRPGGADQVAAWIRPVAPSDDYRYAGGPKPCAGCGAPMFWWITPAGKRSPHDADGTSHFASCPRAQEFRG